MPIFSRRSKRASVVPPTPATDRPPVSSTQRPQTHGGGAGVWREERVREIGLDYLSRAKQHRFGLLSKQFWSDKIMEWSMKDHAFKVQMFRFVDAFPTLRTPDAVHEHLVDYLTQPGVTAPPGMSVALKAGSIAKGAATKTIGGQIEGMAHTFIAGTDAADALPGLKKIWHDGIAFSVDLLGEACLSDAEADMYRDKYMDLVGNLPEEVSHWATNDRLERDHLGVVPRTNVSIKISSLSAKCDPIDTEGSIKELMTRLRPILELAREKGVLINFDMEHSELKDLTLELFMRCCDEIDFIAGIAMQAYLKSGDDDARRISEWAQRTGRRVTVRLVKGAYWDAEVIHAEEQGWPCPVWNTKPETDACFERMTEIFLDAMPRSTEEGGVKLALGSHNVRSIAAALDGLERRGLPTEAFELQMLHGMADQLKGAAVDMGLRIREYVPVGEMIPGMAYLVRRLLENTSNESWLRAGFLDDADPVVLLASPHVAGGGQQDLYMHAAERHELSPAVVGVGDGRAFSTAPLRDFSHDDVRQGFGEWVEASRVPEVANDATVAEAEQAVGRAQQAFAAWRDTEAFERAQVLVRVAQRMRMCRDELAGVMCREAGKVWREADADVCEAIDFCEYYARCAPGLFERERLGKFIGELDEQWYQARGVAVVIAPWNFPLAICTGMTVAALVCGNTVVVKPAEQTVGIASIMAQMITESIGEQFGGRIDAAGVFQMVAGEGETVGAALVRDPRVSLLAFTGSKAVGLDIIRAAGVTHERQTDVKKVICEMGGKNAIIVDTSADLDEAVVGVRHSAFGFQGQKCSACSRVIVVDPQGPEGPQMKLFTERLVEATRALVVGSAIEAGTDVGPVIDKGSYDKVHSYIEKARAESTLLLGDADFPSVADLNAENPAGVQPGFYVAPHIFGGVCPDHAIAREEIFGPVLAVMHAETFDAALQIANDSPYKLTGGVFSRMPSHLEKAKQGFRVGNLYLNRGCTGALVARQPFGGFGMSGVGSKAGGRDYLLQFVEPRASCENTMRRGFAPEL